MPTLRDKREKKTRTKVQSERNDTRCKGEKTRQSSPHRTLKSNQTPNSDPIARDNKSMYNISGLGRCVKVSDGLFLCHTKEIREDPLIYRKSIQVFRNAEAGV